MSLVKKKYILNFISDLLSDQSRSIFLFRFNSISSNSISKFRKSIKLLDSVDVFVAKNTIVKRSCSSNIYSPIIPFLKGNIIICVSPNDFLPSICAIKKSSVFNLDSSLVCIYSLGAFIDKDLLSLSLKFDSVNSLRSYLLSLFLFMPSSLLFLLSKNPNLLANADK